MIHSVIVTLLTKHKWKCAELAWATSPCSEPRHRAPLCKGRYLSSWSYCDSNQSVHFSKEKWTINYWVDCQRPLVSVVNPAELGLQPPGHLLQAVEFCLRSHRILPQDFSASHFCFSVSPCFWPPSSYNAYSSHWRPSPPLYPNPAEKSADLCVFQAQIWEGGFWL